MNYSSEKSGAGIGEFALCLLIFCLLFLCEKEHMFSKGIYEIFVTLFTQTIVFLLFTARE